MTFLPIFICCSCNAIQVKIIAFDKTGTITEGKASVTSFTNFSAVVPSGPLVALIGAAESNSEHPIGKAIFAFAVDQLSEEEKELPRCENFEATPGYGLQCEIVYDSYTIYPNETKGRYSIFHKVGASWKMLGIRVNDYIHFWFRYKAFIRSICVVLFQHH